MTTWIAPAASVSVKPPGSSVTSRVASSLKTLVMTSRAYLPSERRLPGPMMADDIKGVGTSAVKIRGGLLDGDHHRS